jgi:methionyl-tRNA formyltransferase
MTGVSMLQLEDGIDDGPVYGQKSFPISPRATIAELIAASGHACAALIDELLPRILSGSARPVAQSGTPSYGLQRRPEDGRIQWSSTAGSIDRLVRAVGRPYPGAFSYLDGQHISIWRTALLSNSPHVFGCPGQIARLPGVEFPCVVTGDGVIAIIEATDPTGLCAIRTLKHANQRRFTAE